MNSGKRTHAVACLLLCAALLLMTGCQSGLNGLPDEETRAPLLYINGEAVSIEELDLLDGDVDRATRMKTLQQWARELGLADPFSFEALMDQLAEENARRAATKENGGIVYGVVEYTPLQYYNITMGEYERLIREELLSQADETDLRAYYQEHLENYREIGEITAQVTVRSGSQILNEREVSLSPETYRSLSEENESLVAALETLWEGEKAAWTDEYGLEWTALCTGRAQDSYQPFEDVRGAVGAQYTAAQLTQELDRRVGESAVEDLRQNNQEK